MTAPLDLPAIRSLHAGITGGEWDYEKFDNSFGVYSLEMRDNGDYPAVIGYPLEDETCTEVDAAFIAAAPSIVAHLLGIVDAQQAKLEAVATLVEEWHKRYADSPFGDDPIEDALDDQAYRLEDIINGTDFAAITGDGEQLCTATAGCFRTDKHKSKCAVRG